MAFSVTSSRDTTEAAAWSNMARSHHDVGQRARRSRSGGCAQASGRRSREAESSAVDDSSARYNFSILGSRSLHSRVVVQSSRHPSVRSLLAGPLISPPISPAANPPDYHSPAVSSRLSLVPSLPQRPSPTLSRSPHRPQLSLPVRRAASRN